MLNLFSYSMFDSLDMSKFVSPNGSFPPEFQLCLFFDLYLLNMTAMAQMESRAEMMWRMTLAGMLLNKVKKDKMVRRIITKVWIQHQTIQHNISEYSCCRRAMAASPVEMILIEWEI